MGDELSLANGKESVSRRGVLAIGCGGILGAIWPRMALSQQATSTGHGAHVELDVPADLSNVRGFNYSPASAKGYGRPEPHYRSMWLDYNPAETDLNLDMAGKLNLNHTRAMMSYVAWSSDKDAYRKKIQHFVRACHKRGIGVMMSNTYNEDPGWERGSRQAAKEFAEDLVRTLENEPGLKMWDVSNEPDLKKDRSIQMDGAKFMAETFHRLDPKTPVTIGAAAVAAMKELAEYVDVLQFHDYSPTRSEIRAHIEDAKTFAFGMRKPVFDGEIGCIARANPYDVTLQEHMDAKMGWYIWELMIVREGWGPVHGVFYPDGTVRDPSIAAAILGVFRNRGANVVLEQPDREGWVTRAVTDAKKWLSDPAQDWEAGIRIAEIEANLLEASQLIAMRELPTRIVALLRADSPDLPGLRSAIQKFTERLVPWQG
jgi:hypothetical protein